MDDSLYDEFGNYLGPDLEDEDLEMEEEEDNTFEEEEEEHVQQEQDEQALMQIDGKHKPWHKPNGMMRLKKKEMIRK